MANIDVAAFLEHCGIRKARFGGYEPDDVRLAMEAFGAEYEERMARVEQENRTLQSANAGLEKHCQALAAQTRLLTDQNVSLASSNEKFSKQGRELAAQVTLLREKNRSLSDQNATYLLRNGDLTKLNQQLRARTDAAERALAEKGAGLDAEKIELDNKRAELIGEARTKADALLAGAQDEVQRMQAEAKANAEATLETARAQARRQAQELVDGATSEANEIHNINQLRLKSLKAEVAQLETRRDALVRYLAQMGGELLRVEELARAVTPDQIAPPPAPAPADPQLEPLETPALQLDLTPETVARTAAAMAKPAPAPVQPDPAPPAPEEPKPAPLPEYLRQVAETAEELPPKAESVPGEVPGAPVGAIFSSPIVHPAPQEIRAEQPAGGPRAPVMPDFSAEEPEGGEETPPAPFAMRGAPAARASFTGQRRRAMRIIRGLRRMRQNGRG